jgi:hypothetical protein
MDAKMVVDCVNGTYSLATIDHFILDCINLLALGENNIVRFVSRNCNSVAHDFAHDAIVNRSWLGYALISLDCPSFFSTLFF